MKWEYWEGIYSQGFNKGEQDLQLTAVLVARCPDVEIPGKSWEKVPENLALE